MSNPASNDPRSPELMAREVAVGEVSDVLLNVGLALGDALSVLQRTHTRLMQDAYYAGDSLRLI